MNDELGKHLVTEFFKSLQGGSVISRAINRQESEVKNWILERSRTEPSRVSEILNGISAMSLVPVDDRAPMPSFLSLAEATETLKENGVEINTAAFSREVSKAFEFGAFERYGYTDEKTNETVELQSIVEQHGIPAEVHPLMEARERQAELAIDAYRDQDEHSYNAAQAALQRIDAQLVRQGMMQPQDGPQTVQKGTTTDGSSASSHRWTEEEKEAMQNIFKDDDSQFDKGGHFDESGTDSDQSFFGFEYDDD